VPSHEIIPGARREAIEALVDETLADVRATGDIALLHECRALFRGKVPLAMRAYVAAALLLRATGGAYQSRGRGRKEAEHKPGKPEASRVEAPQSRQPRERDGKKRDAGTKPTGAKPTGTKPVEARQEQRHPEKQEKQARQDKQPDQAREPLVRENRYRGEGVTLFANVGRRQRFYARVALKTLQEIPGVTEDRIGDIRTMDNYSFIEVDPAVEEAVIAALDGTDYKGRTLAVNRARKKGEPAPVAGDRPPRNADDEEPVRDRHAGYDNTASDDSVSDDDDLDGFGKGPADDAADDDGLDRFGEGLADDTSDDDGDDGLDRFGEGPVDDAAPGDDEEPDADPDDEEADDEDRN